MQSFPTPTTSAPSAAPDGELQELVLATARTHTGRALDSKMPLLQGGISSLVADSFVAELEQKTGLSLSPTVMFEYSTAAALAEHLATLLGKRKLAWYQAISDQTLLTQKPSSLI